MISSLGLAVGALPLIGPLIAVPVMALSLWGTTFTSQTLWDFDQYRLFHDYGWKYWYWAKGKEWYRPGPDLNEQLIPLTPATQPAPQPAPQQPAAPPAAPPRAATPTPRVFTVGRDAAQADIQFSGGKTSRRQFTIQATGKRDIFGRQGALLSDFGSTNGTFVRNTRGQFIKLTPNTPVRIRSGDQIAIGTAQGIVQFTGFSRSGEPQFKLVSGEIVSTSVVPKTVPWWEKAREASLRWRYKQVKQRHLKKSPKITK